MTSKRSVEDINDKVQRVLWFLTGTCLLLCLFDARQNNLDSGTGGICKVLSALVIDKGVR